MFICMYQMKNIPSLPQYALYWCRYICGLTISTDSTTSFYVTFSGRPAGSRWRKRYLSYFFTHPRMLCFIPVSDATWVTVSCLCKKKPGMKRIGPEPTSIRWAGWLGGSCIVTISPSVALWRAGERYRRCYYHRLLWQLLSLTYAR